MLNVIFWLIFGLLVGWIGAILVSANAAGTHRMVLGGILGAVLGGSCAQMVGSGDFLLSRSDPTSIAAAVVGAIVFVGLLHNITNQAASG